MSLTKRYASDQAEPALMALWQESGVYHFDPGSSGPVFSIDTPPPTVSGQLHLGHVYSYSQADFIARFARMRGYNVFYPMGFDDNGLPTERLVEKTMKIRPWEVDRQEFIRICLQTSVEAEEAYRALWQRLGLSVDWRHTYRTIDETSRKVSQFSFIDLYRKGLIYRLKAPTLWCPECQTGIAQADLEDLERDSEFVTLQFQVDEGSTLPVATTRPELLPACVAVFVHPGDERYAHWVGRQVRVPFYNQLVPVLTDLSADPAKGTGAVMCCTFGDQTDVAWWYTHKLPRIEAIDRRGRMTAVAGALAGLPVKEARRRIKDLLAEQGQLTAREATIQSVRVHERCDTPVEFMVTPQWFIRVLDNKEKFLELGAQLRWHPEHMQARYHAWVENLSWDWCISRQRYYGVPFPVWFCQDCGEVMLAEEEQLPVDPGMQSPARACKCGSKRFQPDTDVMDTWATSSTSPQIVTGWLTEPDRFAQLFPLTLRPQAHEIIRTWAFYSIVKSYYHFGKLPWSDIFISGWAIAGEGMGKISKSRGGGPLTPMTMIQQYSADAVRYWAASTSPGKDSIISVEKIQMGNRLVTKLWNVARFVEPFISGELPPAEECSFTPADRWILARCRRLIHQVTADFERYDYAAVKNELDSFFWHNLADNYLEMAKQRLYDGQHPAHYGACRAVKIVFNVVLKLFAPLLPYITDTIYQELYGSEEDCASIHAARWPDVLEMDGIGLTEADDDFGEMLIAIASAVRRYKSENALSLGSELPGLYLASGDDHLLRVLRLSAPDLGSVTRALNVEAGPDLPPGCLCLTVEEDGIQVGILLNPTPERA